MGEPTIDSAIDTAVWFVEWCRSNLDQAQVLRAGMRTFGPDDWSADDRAAADQTAILHTVLNALKVLAQQAAASEDQVVFAILELPVAVVRRRLEDGRPPGVREAELIRSLAPSSSHSGDGNPHRQTHFQATSRSPMPARSSMTGSSRPESTNKTKDHQRNAPVAIAAILLTISRLNARELGRV
ncbi:hypothetical protein J8M97_10525 [Gordonia polyisoprenivorans]|uniref:hypothetical protein n=1 Tax=Gordonia polyisoprenivorans TaxID=84595 RepID=UPI001B8B479B|nr:hypothetical protein [Gordonia polyisoprenivorans]QUD84958.1 hypothetical protein J8M97_10525 [Gordonia polyisoprenivorans]